MLSLILYGRNDSYGYNLHKRAAISLNCMAEVLTGQADEIIFVDYNTPDDFPTFPEAIQDTLTARAKSLLRILRVRPSQHERFREQTALVALEPIARNVAIRRSNPANRWILSTNTDMVFVPRRDRSLSELAADLPDAYYHLPRFEIPEPLWESLDRLDPAEIIATVRAWGSSFHLNEIAFSQYPMIKYDGPGDFQLMLRSDAWQVYGFNEAMLLGWHVDSNMAKRLSLLPRRMGDVVDDVYGYHCDHTRQVTPAHKHRGTHNSMQVYFEDVVTPFAFDQATTWGLAGESVEELRIDTTSRLYLEGLRAAIPTPLEAPTELRNFGVPEERVDHAVDHVMPFLAGLFATDPRGTVLGWVGAKKSLLSRFAALWKTMGFYEPIVVSTEARWLGPDLPQGCVWGTEEALGAQCQVLVFEFGMAEGEHAVQGWESDVVLDTIASGFSRLVRAERLRQAKAAPARRFIGVNPIVRNDVRELFNANIAAASTPDSTHIKHGVVGEPAKLEKVIETVRLFEEFDCLPVLQVGPAGDRAPVPARPHDCAIHAKQGVAGFVAFGPYISLPPGRYEAAFDFYGESSAAFTVDAASDRGNRILAQDQVKPQAGGRHLGSPPGAREGPLTRWLCFDVGEDIADDSIEFRVWSPGKADLYLVALRVRQVVAFSENGAAGRDQVLG